MRALIILSLFFTVTMMYSGDRIIAEHAKRLAFHHLSINNKSPHGHVFMRLAYTLNPDDPYVLKLHEKLYSESSAAYLPPIQINRSSSRILAALLYEDLVKILKNETLSEREKRQCVLYAKLISFCNNDTSPEHKIAQGKALKFGNWEVTDLLKQIPKAGSRPHPGQPTSARTVHIAPSQTTIPPTGLKAHGPNKIVITCDNVYKLYVNGKFTGTDNKWETAETYQLNLDPGDVITVEATDLGNGLDTVGFACLVYDSKKVKSTPHGWYYKTQKPAEGWQKSKNVTGWKVLSPIRKPQRPIKTIKGLEKSCWGWSKEKEPKLYLKYIN